MRQSPANTAGATPACEPPGVRPIDPVTVGLALVLGTGLMVGVLTQASATHGLLLLVGAGLGVTLYHAAFGFSGGWRRALDGARTAGLRAQLLLLAATSTVFAPLLAWGASVSGFVAPLSLSLAVGAFLFGIGMQLGGGCGSGTLFLAGAGRPRMVIVLLAFIAGSVIATFHLPWWRSQPAWPQVGLIAETGVLGAITTQLTCLGAMTAGLCWFERRRYGDVEPIIRGAAFPGWPRRVLTGPWPWLWGVIGLSALSAVTLLAKGSPWGITFGFALWGAQGLQALGFDIARFAYWQGAYPGAALEQGILGNAVSVMNLGLLVGALLAAGLAGRFRTHARQTPTRVSALSAIVAGLAMGYGARLAFGCNIGAMLGGIASASLHGWVWFALAFGGFAAMARLRCWVAAW